MPTFATFQRLKDKGLAALRDGDYTAARPYLIQAAECMIDIAAANNDADKRDQQQAYAKELIELAKDCERRGAGGGKAAKGRDRAREGDDGGASAQDWIIREKPNIHFDDVAGLEDVKDEIRLKMLYPFQHPELAKRYGIEVGGGVLLFGPPGTGKTMIAKAIATELDATIFVVSPAQLMSKWVGEAEQNVRKLFDAADAEPRSVIFIDEIEALVPRRRSSDSTVMQRVVPQILQELEGFDRRAGRALLFLGATNEPWSLDPAVLRPGRFDAKVYVPLPDPAARFKLFEIYLTGRPLADNVNLAELAEQTGGYSGADIKAVCDRAAARVFLESVDGGAARNIDRQDVLATLAATPPSVSRKDCEKFEQWGAQQG